jgi:drug/metabolite transporter (DMT)-like permease
MQHGITTVMLMQIRSVISAAIVIVLISAVSAKQLRIHLNDLPGLILLAIPGLVVVNFSYYRAVKLLPVAVAVFIQFTAPVLVFLYGMFKRKEHATLEKLIALVLCITGTYLMVHLHDQRINSLPIEGLLCAFVSMLSYAFYLILSHRLGEKHSPWTLLVYGYGIAGIFWCLVQNIFETTATLTANHIWSRSIFFALLSTLIPFSIFLIGIRKVTPTGAAIASTSETVSASLFAFFFLGEKLGMWQIFGAAFILAAILILIYQGRKMPILQELDNKITEVDSRAQSL